LSASLLVSLFDSETDDTPQQLDTTWPEFVERLSDYRLTDCPKHEPGRKCNARKGPAFSPAVFDGSGRKATNVLAHTLFVADLDHVTSAQMSEFSPRLEGREVFLGTTHSSDPSLDDYCFRLVMPLTEAVERIDIRRFRAAVIQMLQIPGVDRQTVDESRLYFLPSAPATGPEPRYLHSEGEPLDVAALLAAAPELPPVPEPRVSPPPVYDSGFDTPTERDRALEKLRKSMSTTASPESREIMTRVLAGEDVLGEPGGHDDRLNRACRILAGIAMNVDTRVGVPECLDVLGPSLAVSSWGGPDDILEYAGKKLERHLGDCRARVLQEQRLNQVTAEFAARQKRGEIPPPDPQADPLDQWALTQTGRDGSVTLASDGGKVLKTFRYEDRWHGAFRENRMSGEIEIHPCNPLIRLDGNKPRGLLETDVTEITTYLAEELGTKSLSATTVRAHIDAAAHRNLYDPLGEYLDSLVWDGTERITEWIHQFLGVSYWNGPDEITQYVQAVSRKWMIGAIARAYNPGCKMDTTLILEGDQGVGKSSTVRLLADPWFTDDAGMVLGDKDTKMLISRYWVVEMPELATMRRQDIETVKAFITRQTDMFRPPYGRAIIERPRRCVFVGTTNKPQYLMDETGNRRFWVLKCGSIDREGLAAARDQLWAEAIVAYRAGEQWWLTPEEQRIANSESEDRQLTDEAWKAKVLELWVQKGKPQEVNTRAVLEWLGYTPDRADRAAQTRAGLVLKDLGFERRRHVVEGVRQYVYIPSAKLMAYGGPAGAKLSVVT
jgi:predicted P-loop ATPase